MKERNLLITLLSLTLLLAGAGLAQKADFPKQPDTLAMASEKTKELLLLMDPDKNGKISKQEWMKFMEAEFDKLDPDKTGELDPKELRQKMSRVSVRGSTGR